MDRKTGDRTSVTIRLRKTGLAEVDRLAESEGVTRSDMIRTLLREAITARVAGESSRA